MYIRTHKVYPEEFPESWASDWGLYQMHGNVWEWCQGWYGNYPPESAIDPEGPPSGDRRVLRGGLWIGGGRRCSSAYRVHDAPSYRFNFDFRLARGH